MFISEIRASITSGFWANSRALCLDRVWVCAGEVPGVEVVDFDLAFGVLGLTGTEAILDRGRGLKSESLSEEKAAKDFLGSGEGRTFMMETKGLLRPMILEYPAPRLSRSEGWSWFLRMISLVRRGSWVEDWYLLWAFSR